MIRDNINRLYRITNPLGSFYIVARSFDAAAEALLQRLDGADFGRKTDRVVTGIELVAEEIMAGERQSFTGYCDLIVQGGAVG